jgi:cobaltochelatase CobS
MFLDESNYDTSKLKVKLFPVATTFDIPADPKLAVPGFETRLDFVPEAQPEYVFRKELMSDLLAWFKRPLGLGISLIGPTGSGKSSIIEQISARLNIPMYNLTGNKTMEFCDLIGRNFLVNGSQIYVYGPLTLAYKYGGVFLLDENDNLAPSTALALNAVAQRQPLLIPETSELVKCNPNFRFVVTSNTGGVGDITGLYQGTERQNIAFVDRFWKVKVGYVDAERELTILIGRRSSDGKTMIPGTAPKCPDFIARKMVSVANDIRAAFMGTSKLADALPFPMSTRALILWANLYVMFRNRTDAINSTFDTALGNIADPDSHYAMHQIIQRHFGDPVQN